MIKHTFNIAIKKHGRLLVDIKDFHYADNKITFLFGESGIGKSLISKVIYGILDSVEFHITVNNKSYKEYCQSEYPLEIQENSFFVFQEPSTHLNPLMKLTEQMYENNFADRHTSSKVFQKLWDTTDNEFKKNILNIYPKPYRPSGGEKQRFLLAMAFAKIEKLKYKTTAGRNLFVFDEPSGSLDNYFRDIFLSYLLEEYKSQKYTALFITHDYSIISAIKNIDNNLIDNIDYKELAIEGNRLTLRNFAPIEYLDWIKEQKKNNGYENRELTRKELLSLESGVEVIKKRIYISKEREQKLYNPLKIYSYSITYLKAPSGVGKTTLAKSIMGLIKATQLRIKIKNKELNESTSIAYWKKYIWGKQIAMTFQHADEAINQESTVGGTLKGLKTNMSYDEIIKLMSNLFELTVDSVFLRKKVKYLSGGQKQKLNLIRSFVLNTDILILDEPLNGLDFKSIQKVLKMIELKRLEGKGVLIISHNEEIFDSIVNPENVYYIRSE